MLGSLLPQKPVCSEAEATSHCDGRSDEFTGVANLQAELTNPSVAGLALTMQGCGYVVARNTAETTKADRFLKY